jgi:protein-L-isoaspartate(D-aspartate) O-methyltransferase
MRLSGSQRSYLAALAALPVMVLAAALSAGPPGFAPEREAMVVRLRQQHISNERVLSAIRKVPRHVFVDAAQRAHAYDDTDVPLGSGQVMCSPYLTALMAQVLDPKPTAKILEVGTGSGYLAAVLSEITTKVYTVDIRADLANAAQARLRSLHSSAKGRIGHGCQGWPEEAPFDGIVVTCAADRVPEPLIAQLREGGRLVIAIGHGPEQTLNCLRKSGGRLRAETIMATRLSPMVCQGAR